MNSASTLRFESTPLSGLHKVSRSQFTDERGSFSRLYCAESFTSTGWIDQPVQINLSRTVAKGTIRGFHFQREPHTEGKVVLCLSGEVFDVVVDLRKNSPTFLQWHADILSATRREGFVIPKGFAHGFQSLTDDVELLYLHSERYHPADEAGIHPFDPSLGISWPVEAPLLSPRDAALPRLAADFKGIEA